MRNRTPSTPLQTVLTGLPIVVASLYFLGVCFYQGFTRKMGLEESLFPLSVDRTLFNGFFALLDLSAPQIGYFLLAAELIALVAMAAVFLSSTSRVRSVGEWLMRRSQNKKVPAQKEPPLPVTEFANFSAQMFVYAIVIFFAFLGVLLAGVVADKSGQATANNLLKKIEDGKQPPIDLFLVGKDTPIVAHPILCSAMHCAFLTNKKSVTYRHELVEKTITHNISVNTDAAR